MGRRRGPHFEITGATFQGEQDNSTPWSFERIDERHSRDVLAAWNADDHQTTLIGDWHSHPSGAGDPSGTDRRAWRKLADSGRADCIGLILVPVLPRVFLVHRSPPFHKVVEASLFADEPDDLVFGVGSP